MDGDEGALGDTLMGADDGSDLSKLVVGAIS